MLFETFALTEKYQLLVAALVVGAVAGMSIERARAQWRRQAWKKRNGWRWQQKPAPNRTVTSWAPQPVLAPKPADAADQLRVVMDAHFTPQPLLNRSEARVFRELDRFVQGCNPGWQVMAQVSLGEILRCKDANAYGCVNAKRVDLLLVDEDCQPRLAIEYQGGAHHQGSAAARDAVKKEACAR